MEIQKGSVVRSKAGRDKGIVFMVLSLEGDMAYVADGKKRKTENPKGKKLKHLQGYNDVLDIEVEVTNSKVRKALAVYR